LRSWCWYFILGLRGLPVGWKHSEHETGHKPKYAGLTLSLINLNERKAARLHEQAQSLSDAGEDDEAIALYLQAVELDPKRSESFYNIGLIYKYRGEWEKSLQYNARAYELAPDDEAARWNLAIAATALREWDIARSAWRDNGIELEGDSGPINMNFGSTPVRLNPDGNGEVVWATRIDPVRARIESVPYRESGFRHGDIVLHDGAAVGYREVGGKEYPVFNVLELFEPSRYRTLVARVRITCDEDIDVLKQLFVPTRHDFEDWTTGIKMICRQCSEGKPHEHHDQELAEEWLAERTLGVAVFANEPVQPLFETWQQQTGAKLLELET
jgi:hypothetical protein